MTDQKQIKSKKKADYRAGDKDMSTLYVAFKGNGNSANKVVRSLDGDKLFLTNTHSGLKNDIDNINDPYDFVYMFGLDKRLKGDVRIDRVAQRGDTSVQSLCNEAYWYMLRKFNGHMVFFHVPSMKYITENL